MTGAKCEWSDGAGTAGPRIHGVWSLQCVLHEAGVSRTPRHSLKQRRPPVDAEESIPSYFLQLPQVLVGIKVLGIACCRVITALYPLDDVAHPRRSPAVLTVDQRRPTNQLLLCLPQHFSQGFLALGNIDCKESAPTHPGCGQRV